MSDSKNTKTENGKTGNTEKKKPGEAKKIEPVKTAPEAKAPESSKSDRLDRMEEQLNLIEDGILILINSTQWHNLSITSIGTHDPNKLIDGCASLYDAVALLTPDEDEKISQ